MFGTPLAGIQLIIVLLHIVVACVIIYRRRQESLNPANIYLAYYLIFVALYSLTDYAVFQLQNPYFLAIILTNISPIWYLVGPFLYFYVRNTMYGTSKLSLSDSWHFIPFIIQSIHIFPYLLSSYEFKLEMAQQVLTDPRALFSIPWGWLYPSKYNYVIRPLMGFIYSLASFRFLYQNTNLFINRSIYQNDLFKWFLVLLTGITFLYSISMMVVIEVLTRDSDIRLVLAQSTLYQSLGIIYVFIGIVPLLFPHILYGNIERLLQPGQSHYVDASDRLDAKGSHSDETHIPKDRLQEIDNLVRAYIHTKKPYTQPDFNMTKLSEVVDIPEYQLYYYFRYFKKQKFVDYRIQLRVEFAKTLLASGATNELTLEAVAHASGYQYRTTFIEHFKKVTGMLPSEYMNVMNPLRENIAFPFPTDPLANKTDA
jgi:AraC-like DNA-binding protein